MPLKAIFRMECLYPVSSTSLYHSSHKNCYIGMKCSIFSNIRYLFDVLKKIGSELHLKNLYGALLNGGT